MSSVNIQIECPANILNALKETPDEFAQEARILLAAKLYEMVVYPQDEPQNSPA